MEKLVTYFHRANSKEFGNVVVLALITGMVSIVSGWAIIGYDRVQAINDPTQTVIAKDGLL